MYIKIKDQLRIYKYYKWVHGTWLVCKVVIDTSACGDTAILTNKVPYHHSKQTTHVVTNNRRPDFCNTSTHNCFFSVWYYIKITTFFGEESADGRKKMYMKTWGAEAVEEASRSEAQGTVQIQRTKKKGTGHSTFRMLHLYYVLEFWSYNTHFNPTRQLIQW